MASILKVDTIQDQAGNNIISENANVITIGASGDTITVPAGATVSGFTSAGIDDNATSTAITIDNTQRVGIGTATPSQLLEIYGTSPNVQWTYSGDGNNHRIFSYSDDFYIRADANNTGAGNLVFQNGGSSERMRINSSGNVGIGTSSPNTTLEVESSSTSIGSNGNLLIKTSETNTVDSGGQLTLGNTSYRRASIAGRQESSGTAGYLQFGTRSSSGDITERMRINSSGNVGIGTASPSDTLHASDSGNSFIQSNTTSTSGIGGFRALNNSSTEIKLFSYGTTYSGTFAGVTNANLSLLEAQGSSNLLFSTWSNAGGSNPDFIFAPQRSQKLIIKSDGNVGIGTTAPTQPLQVEGIALSKPKLGMNSFGGGGAPNADRERARQGLWRASSDRGAFSLSTPAGGIDYNAFSTSTNNSYIVWDLLVTNCSEIVVVMKYANSADSSTRSVVSEYSVDGGSTYTQLGTGSFGAGGVDCGGTITFSNTSYQNQTYVKIRTAFTSGAPLNSTLRQYIGLKEVFFTPLCSSVSYQKCLG